MRDETWSVVQEGAEPARAAHFATVFALANGVLGTRGTDEESKAGTPSTFIAGTFTMDALGFKMLPNTPNWLATRLRVNGEPFDPASTSLEAYRRTLDMHGGVVRREVIWRAGGARVRVESARFLSLPVPHVAAMEYAVTVEEGSAYVILESGFDLDAPFRGERYLDTLSAGERDSALLVVSETTGSHIRIASAAHIVPIGTAATTTLVSGGDLLLRRFEVEVRAGERFGFRKIVAYATSRDGVGDETGAALERARTAAEAGYETLHERHCAAWAQQWDACAVGIEGDPRAERALRYSMFQLLGAASRTDDRVSLGAKLLSGDGYRHHVFWDTDLFMMPMLLHTQPGLARLMMQYRYRMLDGARRNAAANGYTGAWYPWESADDGTEACPTKWIDDQGGQHPIRCGEFEIHSVCDVAEAVRHYVRMTGDEAFLWDCGVEMLVEMARFWVSRATWNDAERRFELLHVMGPDEWHEDVNNSAYINVLARRTLRQAVALARRMSAEQPEQWRALIEKIALADAELDEMRRTADALYIPFDPERGVYVEFDGFEDLTPFDGDPREAHTVFTTEEQRRRVKIVKQADVLMLLYLLWEEHDLTVLRANWDAYVPLTEHNTSLSASTHAIVGAWLGKTDKAYRFFTTSAEADLGPVRPDTDAGLHGAAMGGTWMAAVHGLCGIRFTDRVVLIEPHLPPHWRRVIVPLVWRGVRFTAMVSHAAVEIDNKDETHALTVKVLLNEVVCGPGQTTRHVLPAGQT